MLVECVPQQPSQGYHTDSRLHQALRLYADNILKAANLKL